MGLGINEYTPVLRWISFIFALLLAIFVTFSDEITNNDVFYKSATRIFTIMAAGVSVAAGVMDENYKSAAKMRPQGNGVFISTGQYNSFSSLISPSNVLMICLILIIIALFIVDYEYMKYAPLIIPLVTILGGVVYLVHGIWERKQLATSH